MAPSEFYLYLCFMRGQIERIKEIYSDLNELRENGKVYNKFETKVKLILLELRSLLQQAKDRKG